MSLEMDDDTRQSYDDWINEVKSFDDAKKLSHAEHLWNEYEHRHNLIWNLVLRLTAAVVVLAVIPYTQNEVTDTLGRWILAPPILGVVLAIIGFVRVRRELGLLHNIRKLNRSIQNRLFYKFHDDEKSTFLGKLLAFNTQIQGYIIILIVLAVINVLLIAFCWIPKLLGLMPESWVCRLGTTHT